MSSNSGAEIWVGVETCYVHYDEDEFESLYDYLESFEVEGLEYSISYDGCYSDDMMVVGFEIESVKWGVKLLEYDNALISEKLVQLNKLFPDAKTGLYLVSTYF